MRDNSDIAANAEDEQYVLSQYPLISDSLLWPELVQKFMFHERVANETKAASRRSSVYAIICVVFSLCATLISTSPIATNVSVLLPRFSVILACLALILLVLAIGLGKGVLFGARRDQWLRNRLAAERLRHFYFQFLLNHRKWVCRGGELAITRLREKRAIALERVYKDITSDEYMQTVLDDSTLEESFLLERREVGAAEQLQHERLDELRRYWCEFRFEWQIKYATKQTMRKYSTFSLGETVAEKEHWVTRIEFASTLAIVVLQSVAIAGQLSGDAVDFLVPAAVLATSIFAVFIVGLQAYKEGVGLSEDLSRYRMYSSYGSKLFRDWRASHLTDDLAFELRAMYELEDLSYFETREFLRSHRDARFSL